jgi:hypothetical protein
MSECYLCDVLAKLPIQVNGAITETYDVNTGRNQVRLKNLDLILEFHQFAETVLEYPNYKNNLCIELCDEGIDIYVKLQVRNSTNI